MVSFSMLDAPSLEIRFPKIELQKQYQDCPFRKKAHNLLELILMIINQGNTEGELSKVICHI